MIVFAVFVAVFLFSFFSAMGDIEAVAVISALYAYSGNILYYKSIAEKGWRGAGEHHKAFWFLYLLVTARVVAEFFIEYAGFISRFFSFVFSVLLSFGYFGTIFGLAFVAPLLMFAVSSKIKNERFWIICDWLLSALPWVSIGSFALLLLANLRGISSMIMEMPYPAVGIVIFAGIILFYIVLVLALVSGAFRYDIVANRLDFYRVNDFPLTKRETKLLVKKNKYLLSISEIDRRSLVFRGWKFVDNYLTPNEEKTKTIKMILPVLTHDLLKDLREFEWGDVFWKDRYRVLELVVKKGMSFSDAVDCVERGEEEKLERRNKLEKWFKPVVAVACAIGRFFVRIWEFVCQIKWLWDLFNKLCPRNKQDNVIVINFDN